LTAAAAPESPIALVTLREATVSFGPVRAVRDASLSIHAGESIAVIGANGSGKTSLLRLLHGVVDHSGTRVLGAAPARQAMVFQRPFLLRLSVLNNLRLALWLGDRRLTGDARMKRAIEALQRVGLAGLRDRPARSLSGGEQQRLALARGWALRPDILFLDEPTANLDPSAKKEVESLLAGFTAEGMTLVMSTHNLGQAKRLARRIIYMDGGRVDLDLPTAEFFSVHGGRRADLFLKGDLSWSVE
jgi:tungstate transport system ATP-binding protein